jgi:hypothetical protein
MRVPLAKAAIPDSIAEFLPASATKALAVVADVITVQTAIVALLSALVAVFSYQKTLPAPPPAPPPVERRDTPVATIPQDITDAINGICSREILHTTLRDGSFVRLGPDFALKLKEDCIKAMADEYARLRSRRNEP